MEILPFVGPPSKPPANIPRILFDAPPANAAPTVISSPHAVAFPVDAMFIKSIFLTEPGSHPPANIPLPPFPLYA